MADYSYANGSPIPTVLDDFRNTAVNPADLAFADFIRLTDAEQQRLYKLYRDYYDGNHNTMLTDRMREFLEINNDTEFNLNYTPVPVDTLAERLNVMGFAVPGEGDNVPENGRQGGPGGWLERVWKASRMDAGQGDAHTSAIRDGDAYAIVDWDPERQIPTISIELAFDGTYGCHVLYREDRAREIRYAVKEWRVESGADGGRLRRRNIYTPDQIFKYQLGRGGWEPYFELDAGGRELPWPLPWVDKNGRALGVPVLHFAHNPGGSFFGKSELADIVPIQNALNKTVIDELAAADMTGFSMFTLTGDKPPDDIVIAPGQFLWTTEATARYGSIQAGNLAELSHLVDRFVQRMAQVSRIPLSYFQVTGAIAAADTQKADDKGLVSKGARAAVGFGNTWEDVMAMARRMHNAFSSGPELAELMIDTKWDSFERVDALADDRIKAETAEIKARTFDALLMANPRGDRYQLARMAGYDEGQAAVLADGGAGFGVIDQ